MARKRRETPEEPPKALDVLAATATGDRLTILRALQRNLAERLADAPPQAVAPIASRLLEVTAELDELVERSKPKELSAVDELAKRREDRIADAHVAGSSVRRVRQRQRG